MPAEPSERVHSLEDFVSFLVGLVQGGLDFVVIGGCAVGAYGRLHERELLTVDLDILTDYDTLWKILEWASRHGGVVRKRPQPRNIPVAFLEWEGLEVNVLASTPGLPPPDQTLRLARLVRLSRHGNLPVPLVDPFDLLADKLSVNREKDQPHIAFLREFVEEEIVEEFGAASEPRQRLRGARRLLTILGERHLAEPLALRLLPRAKLPADFRFLADTVPDPLFPEVLVAAPEELRDELRAVRARGPIVPPPI